MSIDREGIVREVDLVDDVDVVVRRVGERLRLAYLPVITSSVAFFRNRIAKQVLSIA